MRIQIILLFAFLLSLGTAHAAQYEQMPPPPPQTPGASAGYYPYQQQQQTVNTSTLEGMPKISLQDMVKQLFDKTGYKYFKQYPALKLFDIPGGE